MKKETAKKRRWINRAAIVAFVLLGVVCLWLPGVRFSAYLCFGLAGVSLVWLLLGLWAERSRAGTWCSCLFRAGCCCVLVILCALETNIVMTARRDLTAIPADAVVVLGAGVNGTVPSLTLRTRLDATLDYLEEHPEMPVVLSGGQGPGEDITEARCMYEYLTQRGISPERILLEENSTSTAENFAFSKAVLEEAGVDVETELVAFVTNDFHMYRAGYLAVQEGYALAFGVPAQLPWRYLEVNYYVREAFALVKTLIFD